MKKHLTKQFDAGLKQLDMLDDIAPDSTGLLFTDNISEQHPFHERIAAEKAKKYGVHGIYFRRFPNGRAPVAQIYIYDFTRKVKKDDEVAELHRKLWNSGQVPLFFVFTKTEIKVFNCLKSPELDTHNAKITTSPMEIIALAAELEDKRNERKRKEFSARNFDNGSFWDTSNYRNQFKLGDSSYESLLKYLKEIHGNVVKQKILDKSIAQKLLVISILIKYLEERVDQYGNTVFPRGFFSRFAEGANGFTDLLKSKGACLELFDYLSNHFNGEIFKWEDQEERKRLTQTDLSQFARFFEARTDSGGQGTLWPIYSFNDLPIELISNIYEEFVGKQNKGVVYTPPYLVHFLVDEVMPLDSPRDQFKILDPSCGSGVFLVAAFQRVIEWWRIRNDWQTPDPTILKQLLKESIFGVDISSEAVRLAIFSLFLVVLDMTSPKEIWENLKFDNLKALDNLFAEDFFELIKEKTLDGKFDLVIGNPPFEEKLTTPAALAIEEERKTIREKISNNNLALLFLEQSLTVCKPGGIIALVQPSEAFLYNYGSFEFRKHFLQSCNVREILDFTPLRETLFGSANAAASVVLAKKEKSGGRPILHAIFRKTKAVKEKIYLELDHYDINYINYKEALNNRLIWKANFLGGGRLRHLIHRLDEFPKFGTYLESKIKKHGWVVGEGFQVRGNKDIVKVKKMTARQDKLTADESDELKRLIEKYKASFLTGKNTLPTEALTDAGIDRSQIHVLDEVAFHRARSKNKYIYKGPHVLIKEEVRNVSIPIAFTDEDLSFKDKIIGIHSPEMQRDELLEIVQRIKGSKLSLFCAGAFSGQHLISRGTAVVKKDIESIPYPGNPSDMELSEIEEILVDDVLTYMLDFREKGEKAVVLQPVDFSQLKAFGTLFCKVLNTVYDNFNVHPPVITDHFVCLPVYYQTMPRLEINDSEQLEAHLQKLLSKDMGENLRITRVLRIYDDNVIYLVKPRQLRYWLNSTAVRDADDTFADLVKQGY
ncbi:MAG: N-6 DNA methylase [bacterium]|nr:N-6 DNA methylase [bacterium]